MPAIKGYTNSNWALEVGGSSAPSYVTSFQIPSLEGEQVDAGLSADFMTSKMLGNMKLGEASWTQTISEMNDSYEWAASLWRKSVIEKDAAIMIAKMALQSWITVARMMKVKAGFRSPEDAKRSPVNPDPHPDHPDQQAQSIHTYGRWLFKTHAYYLRGRWHVDLSKKTLDADDDAPARARLLATDLIAERSSP